MEWLEQTKRISKEEDYMGLDIIDTVMENIWLVSPELIRRNRKFFNDLCDEYHKPNPVSFLGDKKLMKHFRAEHDGKSFHQWQSELCCRSDSYPKGGCRCFKLMRKSITDQMEIQIERYKQAEKVITWQWFEIIDYLWEKPQLVNPALLDEYITKKINSVCDTHKKSNPLTNGMIARFGKFWRDRSGKWHSERRSRI
jgi:hypothetical protein